MSVNVFLEIPPRHKTRRELESNGWKFLGVVDLEDNVKVPTGNPKLLEDRKRPITLTDIATEFNQQYPEVQLKQYEIDEGFCVASVVDVYVRGDKKE